MALSRLASQLFVATATRSLATPLRGALAMGVAQANSLNLVQRSLSQSTCLAAPTKVEQDMAQFLSEEIQTEKKSLKPVETIDGFKLEKDGADLKLVKEANGEKIIVHLNVNHTVDSAEPDDGTQEAPEMKSKPNFEVEVVKSNGETLSFSCSYIFEQPEQQPEEGFEDVFAIDEVTMYEGENWSEKSYAVAGDILDGYLYDLFMNYLDERGVNAAFAEKLSDLSSSYEHSLYINLLERLQKFCKK